MDGSYGSKITIQHVCMVHHMAEIAHTDNRMHFIRLSYGYTYGENNVSGGCPCGYRIIHTVLIRYPYGTHTVFIRIKYARTVTRIVPFECSCGKYFPFGTPIASHTVDGGLHMVDVFKGGL